MNVRKMLQGYIEMNEANKTIGEIDNAYFLEAEIFKFPQSAENQKEWKAFVDNVKEKYGFTKETTVETILKTVDWNCL